MMGKDAFIEFGVFTKEFLARFLSPRTTIHYTHVVLCYLVFNIYTTYFLTW